MGGGLTEFGAKIYTPGIFFVPLVSTIGGLRCMFNCLLALYAKYNGYHWASDGIAATTPQWPPGLKWMIYSGSFCQILPKEGLVVFVGSGANECCSNWITMKSHCSHCTRYNHCTHQEVVSSSESGGGFFCFAKRMCRLRKALCTSGKTISMKIYHKAQTTIKHTPREKR